MMHRRTFIGLAAGTTVALAGCSGDADSDTREPPDSSTDPEDLLPDPGGEWSQGDVLEQEAEMVGAEAGYQARYTDPDGGSHTVELLRWPAEDDAENAVSGGGVYGDWDLGLANGVFSFAVNGDDDDWGRELLASSDGLSEEVVDERT